MKMTILTETVLKAKVTPRYSAAEKKEKNDHFILIYKEIIRNFRQLLRILTKEADAFRGARNVIRYKGEIHGVRQQDRQTVAHLFSGLGRQLVHHRYQKRHQDNRKQRV